VVAAGGDFAFGIRYGALDATETAGAGSTGHRHFPYARRLRIAWHQDASGNWTFDREDEGLWEVFCAECGDTDGPADNQTEPIQRLRGPYSGEHKAKRAAKKHFDEN
jgi:hypothetical protein